MYVWIYFSNICLMQYIRNWHHFISNYSARTNLLKKYFANFAPLMTYLFLTSYIFFPFLVCLYCSFVFYLYFFIVILFSYYIHSISDANSYAHSHRVTILRHFHIGFLKRYSFDIKYAIIWYFLFNKVN